MKDERLIGNRVRRSYKVVSGVTQGGALSVSILSMILHKEEGKQIQKQISRIGLQNKLIKFVVKTCLLRKKRASFYEMKDVK